MTLPRRSVALLGLSVVVLAGFVWFMGPASVFAALSGADPVWAAVAVLAGLSAVVSWAGVFRLLVGTDGPTGTWIDSVTLYAAATFPKNVLPAGHASGPVLTAYLFSKRLDREYVPTLALVAMGELVNSLVSVALAVVGLGGLVALTPPSPQRSALAGGVAVTVAVLGVVGAVVYLRRDVLRALVAAGAYLLRSTVGQLSGRARTALAPDRVEHGTARFGATLRRASALRRTLAVAVVLSVAGWFGFVLALYASGLAVGHRIPLALAAFLVPASGVAGAVPLPGGLGGFEIGFTAALVALIGMAPETAVAATLLYRVATYWAVTIASGLAAAYLSVDVTRLTEAAPAAETVGR